MNKQELRDRIMGMFLGIAIGDALGMPFEKVFTSAELLAMPREAFFRYQNPPKGHPFHDGRCEAGDTTDDTQLSLVVADSLTDCGHIDMDDMARGHVMAMDKRTIGWGKGTTAAVQRLKDGASWETSGTINGAGNGVMMKTSPIGAYLAFFPRENERRVTLDNTLDLAFMTHQSRMGLAQGWVQAMLVNFCLEWVTPERIRFDHHDDDRDFRFRFLSTAIRECGKVEGWYAGKDIDTISDRLIYRLIDLLYEKRYEEDLPSLAERYGKQPFYVYDSMPLAYACFLKHHDSFQAVINAIRVGGDTDTNASIVGALLGAKNGTAVFPQALIDGLKEKDAILDVAERFCDKFIPR